jgi:hypothetical protein
MCLRGDSLGSSKNKRGSSQPYAPRVVQCRCLVCSCRLGGRDTAGDFVAGLSGRQENDRRLGGLLCSFFPFYLEEAIFPFSESRSEPARRYARRQTLDDLSDYAFVYRKLWGTFRIRFSHGRQDAATNFAILRDRIPVDPMAVAATGLVVREIAVSTAALSCAGRSRRI